MDSKPTKTRYRVRNWCEYNAALVHRGSLTVWVEARAVQQWRETRRSGRRGAPRVYSDIAIQCALTLKVVFRLPLRATEGLLRSVLGLMGLALPVPDNTTLSRRQQILRVVIPRYTPGERLHVVVDSTGLKVYGEGEWKVRLHGWGRRRTWRKLHLGVDEASREIVATLLTTANVTDSTAFPPLLEQVDVPLEQVSADGAFDTQRVYGAIAVRGARAAIPPRANARAAPPEHASPGQRLRNATLEAIQAHGRAGWKQRSGYHRRSLAENALYRLKQLFGDRLSARDFHRQDNEAYLRCAALNRITALGMPQSYIAR